MENIFDYHQANLKDFDEAFSKYGWIVYENALSDEFVEEINNSLEDAYLLRRQIQKENGIDLDMAGTLHHLLEPDNFGFKLIEKLYCDEQMRHFLKGNYILNAIGGVINVKDARPYVQNVHRDIRSFTGDLKLMIQMMIILDDFTEENGATYLLSGSHKADIRPDDLSFYSQADRALAKKGSIILFDSHLWHAAGKNYTDKPRRALTLSYTLPFFKQQLDYPRFLGYEFGETLSEGLRQVIGYNARVPANLYEYYQPPHRRMYKQGQG